MNGRFLETVMTYTLTRVLRIIFWSHLQWFAFGRLWYNCLMLFLDVPFLNYWNQMVEMNIQHMPLFLHLVSLHCCEWKLTIIEFPSQNVWVHHAKHKYDLASKRSSKQTDVNKKYKPQVHSFIHSFSQSVSQTVIHNSEHTMYAASLYHVELFQLARIWYQND